MDDFAPNRFLRLVKRITYPARRTQEIELTTEGLEDPNCTIIPIMEVLPLPPSTIFFQLENRVLEGRTKEWAEQGRILLVIHT